MNTGDNAPGGVSSLIGEGYHSYGNYRAYSSYSATALIPQNPLAPLPLLTVSTKLRRPWPIAHDLVPVAPSLYLWQAYDPTVKADLYSTAILTAEGIFLVDPIPLADAPLADLTNENSIVGILVTNANHLRAAPQFSEKFSVPIHRQSRILSG